ncbi:lipopolysaccharide biosynthesis protein [Vibrio vulnificus]|nr:lipopolysaccharide biosynthesis protein [Vibrio vulnificus]MCU8220938.1 lipopolysaccharide biosynthesis protein [Vibrio vulnificus]
MFANIFKNKSKFTKDIFTLASGTMVAQVLPLAVMPLLTRIYTPEDFGILGYYVAAIIIASLIITGRYELALTLPKQKRKAADLCLFSIKLVILNSLLLFVLVGVLDYFVDDWKGIDSWIYLIPLSAFCFAVYQILSFWFISQQGFLTLSKAKITQSGATVISQLLIGLLISGAVGLVVGHTVGIFVSVTLLTVILFKEYKSLFSGSNYKRQLAMAKRYVRFPKFLIISHSLNAFALHGVFIMANLILTSNYAGFFVLAYKMLTAPVSMIASAVGDVFRQKASSDYAKKGECSEIYSVTFKKLLLFSTAPFIVLFFAAPFLFRVAFGDNWIEAGQLAQILIPMAWIMFLCAPLSSLFMIAEKQHYDLIFQAFFAVASMAPFIIYKLFEIEVLTLFAIYSGTMSLAYTCNLILSYKLARGG